MFFDGVLGQKQFIGDLLVRESFIDEPEYFIFSFADAELVYLFLVYCYRMSLLCFTGQVFAGNEYADAKAGEADNGDPDLRARSGVEVGEFGQLKEDQQAGYKNAKSCNDGFHACNVRKVISPWSSVNLQ